MFSKTLILALLAAIAAVPTTHARCYPANEKKTEWTDRRDATSFIQDVCRDFSREYVLNEDRKACVQGKTQKYLFWAIRDQDPDREGRPYYLTPDECYARLEKNVDACDRGGVTNNREMSFQCVSRGEQLIMVEANFSKG